MTVKRTLFFFGLIAVLMCGRAFGQAAVDTIRLQPFLSGLTLPLYVTNANDGTNRIFVVQQRGIIKVVQPGSTTPTDFLNVSGVVSSSGNERGLLGLAFHPQYATNRRFFIYYTRQSDGAIEIAEYETMAGNPNQANPTAVRTIITIPHPSFGNHNGGTILFGPDGFLYAGTGDGGSANDPLANAQNINSLLGKIIRLDINTPVAQVPAYNIPPTNPYAGATPGADEIYAIGMRNPYRFSFDRGGTNQLWAGDVGQDAIEEVDIITLGGNFGWRVYEGTQCTGLDPGLCNPANFSAPVFQYANAGARCSVTGGNVYRGTQKAFGFGAYIHADYCTGEIFQWFNGSQTLRLDSPRQTSSFGEDEIGELYMTGLGSSSLMNGTVEKIVRVRASADFDGDLRTDPSVYRPSDRFWYLLTGASVRIQQFGLTGDIPAAEDVDGDFITDIGVFRPSTGVWYHYRSSDNTASAVSFGLNGDIPAAADYDGDANADLAIFRPSTGSWWIRRSTNPSNFLVVPFGLSGDQPVTGDFDGDGRYDVALWRPSNGTWYWIGSSTGTPTQMKFGVDGDVPSPGDFDGDGRTDIAVFRPSNGLWYIFRSMTGSVLYQQFGLNGDVPVVGDYDGDALDDIALYRPSNGVWYRLNSSSGAAAYTQFGLAEDLPAPKYDAP